MEDQSRREARWYIDRMLEREVIRDMGSAIGIHLDLTGKKDIYSESRRR